MTRNRCAVFAGNTRIGAVASGPLCCAARACLTSLGHTLGHSFHYFLLQPCLEEFRRTAFSIYPSPGAAACTRENTLHCPPMDLRIVDPRSAGGLQQPPDRKNPRREAAFCEQNYTGTRWKTSEGNLPTPLPFFLFHAAEMVTVRFSPLP